MVVGTLALDLETMAGKPANDFELALALVRQNQDWKPETGIKRFNEARAKQEERRALMDSAEIACVCFRSELELVGFHRFKAHGPQAVEGAVTIGTNSERDMLVAVRDYLNQRTDDTTLLVGHNLDGFDLRRLRFRYLANGLQLPGALANPDQPTADTMKIFCRRVSLDHGEMMIALSTVLERLGIPNHKQLVEGDQVGALIAAGQWQTVLNYCLLDVVSEFEVFNRLTGRSASLA